MAKPKPMKVTSNMSQGVLASHTRTGPTNKTQSKCPRIHERPRTENPHLSPRTISFRVCVMLTPLKHVLLGVFKVTS